VESRGGARHAIVTLGPISLYPHQLFPLARQKPFPYKARGSRHPSLRPDAQIAQLVEQRIENPRVAGSIPALGTTTIFPTSQFFDCYRAFARAIE
jgi:hypothetical protein